MEDVTNLATKKIVLSQNSYMVFNKIIIINEKEVNEYRFVYQGKEYKIYSATKLEEIATNYPDAFEEYVLNMVSLNENNEKIYIGEFNVNSNGKLNFSYDESLIIEFDTKITDDTSMNDRNNTETSYSSGGGTVHFNEPKFNEFAEGINEISARTDFKEAFNVSDVEGKVDLNIKCSSPARQNILIEI